MKSTVSSTLYRSRHKFSDKYLPSTYMEQNAQGVLCDCEVTVIIFNLNNGKLFEYSSVEPETVLQKYATYSGPSERRKKDKVRGIPA